ncbi:class II RPD3 type histone deacetylase [Thecamonas trahens ATCC 50062]|uniref:Class II RPD3 type histone deacetylase n=1 Tax=Thecamonas trahens ATCC 50062 TaxID=461836 RepID=A0A0L0D314_THETB|nr:class II RPD3 type histone deacetylase [Thecamonas trahens ATCC 50062]KNC46732.1 class II RPD3 type histone deacetylase [Thecamonas trahens ATCC 50062]|eukprot:XP_013760013.1 class II RPD3 type histone deacetylase [Thecamonas trahens ATCC 50062]
MSYVNYYYYMHGITPPSPSPPPSPPLSLLSSPPAAPSALHASLGVIYDDRMLAHAPKYTGHPERPERLTAVMDRLRADALLDSARVMAGVEADEDDLALVHSREHIAQVQGLSALPQREARLLMRKLDSIYFNELSPLAASVAAGSTVAITHAVLAGELDAGVAVVRPPGHHAEPSETKGFCFYNNVAVAAAAALKSGAASRVLILDWDVHHGNGTQRMFEYSPDVLYISLHRFDHGRFYPGTRYGGPTSIGFGAGKGYSVNIGWNHRDFRPRPKAFVFDMSPDAPDAPAEPDEPETPAHNTAPGDAEYMAAFSSLVMPIATEFDPDLVLISAGFDAAVGDPLGECEVTPQGYAFMVHALSSLPSAKVVIALEGGYNLEAISVSMSASVSALVDAAAPDGPDTSASGPSGSSPPLLAPHPSALRSIATVAAVLAPHWKCLPDPSS